MKVESKLPIGKNRFYIKLILERNKFFNFFIKREKCSFRTKAFKVKKQVTNIVITSFVVKKQIQMNVQLCELKRSNYLRK